MNGFDVPLLFLVFNRPAVTRRVFEVIRTLRPTRLFVAADGPRPDRPGEDALVEETRRIALAVDWPCEVRTLLRDENLGCGRAVSGALGWFFEQVEEGIVLEDDCIPHPDFFPYCATLLERYRHEPRIASIAGTHFLPDVLPHRQSHYVSKYFQMWGWASWRRAWRHYDFPLTSLTEEEWCRVLAERHPVAMEAGYWREILHGIKAGDIDTWDFQFFFSCWREGANHVMPGRNLVSNIGYGPDATHTNFSSLMANLPVHPLTVGPEPVPLEPLAVVDNLIFYLRFLESLTQTWWFEQVLSPERQLGIARTELVRKDRLIRQLEHEVTEKRRQLRAAALALAARDPAPVA